MPKYHELSVPFIRAMVQGMYRFEQTQYLCSETLTREEEDQFYLAYMGGPL